MIKLRCKVPNTEADEPSSAKWRCRTRERLLPDEKILAKVARYEAHLSRLMFKALHEHEALQVRRSGGTAPLARLDVDGLAAD
jgi:hypothetical protein